MFSENEPVASTSTLPIEATGEQRQIAIRLSTKDKSYEIPSTKFLVPANWRRFHLSELINKVLDNSSPIPFDFLINASLLRSSLGAYCASSNTSEEVTLEIEYLPSTLPPQLESTLPAEDWVSDVSLGLRGTILTGSYAGTSSLHSPTWPAPSNLTFSGHDLSVLSCCHVAHPAGIEGKQWIASGGMDRIARVFEYETPSLDLTAALPLPKTIYVLPLHTGPINSIRSHALPSRPTAYPSPHLITAGWDGLIGIWDLTSGVNEGEPGLEDGERKRKRRKPGVVITKSPVSVLQGHVGKVSRAIFDRKDASVAYSAGWDHTVRAWDLTTASESAMKTSDKVILSLAQLASPNLLATGSTDRQIAYWDLRDETTNIALTLAGHTSQVSCLAAHPTSPLLIASGSYDSTVRIWDARSTKSALFVINLPPKEGETENGREKILAIDWDGERLVAGGEGARVVVWKVSGGESSEIVVE